MNIKPIAKLLANYPKLVVIVFTVITLLIGSQALNIYIESDLTKFLPKDDPTIKLWDEINQEFNIGKTIIILVDQTDRVYDIRDPKVLIEMDEIYLRNQDKIADIRDICKSNLLGCYRNFPQLQAAVPQLDIALIIIHILNI